MLKILLMSTEAMTKKIAEYFKTQPVLRAWLFGSFSRGEERPDSDVDLLVRFDPRTTIFDYVRMRDEVSRFLGRNVDIVDEGALDREKYFGREVRQEMVAV